jgi:hypothetical protein
MSSISREGGGNVINFPPAKQNDNQFPGGAKEGGGEIVDLAEARDYALRKQEVHKKSLGALAVEAKRMTAQIGEYNVAQYIKFMEQLRNIHDERIIFLFKDMWCDPHKINADLAFAKAVMTQFSFRFSDTKK